MALVHIHIEPSAKDLLAERVDQIVTGFRIAPAATSGLHHQGAKEAMRIGASLGAPKVARIVKDKHALVQGMPGVLALFSRGHQAGGIGPDVGAVIGSRLPARADQMQAHMARAVLLIGFQLIFQVDLQGVPQGPS